MEANLIPLGIGVPQILIIVIVLLLFFGGKKIPELMRGVGSGIKEFKNAIKGNDSKIVPEEGEKKS